MAAPWEKYGAQTASSGPWAKYGADRKDKTTALERIGKGVADPAIGTGQLLANAGYSPGYQARRFGPYDEGDDAGVYELPGASAQQLASRMNENIRQSEAEYQAKRGENAGTFDPLRVGGNILATLPLAIGSGIGAGSGAAVGGGTSAVQPVTGENYWGEKGLQTVVGTGFGGAIGALASRVSRPTVINPDLKYLSDRGVSMRPDQMMGNTVNKSVEKLRSVPGFGDMVDNAQRRSIESFNRAAYKQVAAPLAEADDTFRASLAEFDTVPVGREGIKKAKDLISNAYDSALSRMRFTVDDQFVSEWNNLKSLASEMPDDTTKNTFNSLIKSKVENRIGEIGTLDGRSVQGVERALNNLATKYAKSQNPTQQEFLGTAFKEAHRIFESAITRQNPQAAVLYNAAKKAHAQRLALLKASRMAGSRDGVFTPDALASGVRSTVGADAFATGTSGEMQRLAETGRRVIGNQYPDSGTPGRLMLGAGLAGGAAYVNPFVAGAAAIGALPYTSAGQQLAQRVLLSQRSPMTLGTGRALGRLAGPAGLLASGEFQR